MEGLGRSMTAEPGRGKHKRGGSTEKLERTDRRAPWVRVGESLDVVHGGSENRRSWVHCCRRQKITYGGEDYEQYFEDGFSSPTAQHP